MTYNAVDNETVKNESGIRGKQNWHVNQFPPQLTKETTGGGTIDPTSKGSRLKPGATSGDTANIRGERHFLMGATSASRVRFEFIYSVEDDPITDTVLVGLLHDQSGTYEGSYLDLTNQEVAVGTFGGTPTSTSVTGINSIDRGYYCRIEYDGPEGETRFRLRGDGLDETVTLGDASYPGREHIAITESNGNADEVSIMWHRLTWVEP